jgi:putative copper export protein/mono/diheme cytochrome c family protein
MPALLTGLDLAGTASLAGTALFRAVVARGVVGAEQRGLDRVLRRLAWASAALALAASLGRLALQAAMLPPGSGLPVLLLETRFGTVWLAHAVLVLAAAAALLARPRWTAAAALALAAVASLPFAGHAAALGGAAQGPALAAQLVHVVAGCAWVGALLPLPLALRFAPATAPVLARRFSPFGLGCVTALAVSSLWSAWVLVGSVPALLGTGYGQWASTKLTLFLAMLGLAAANRWRWTPALAAGAAGARRGLAISVAIEAALGIAVLFAAGELATIPPGIHASPVWPLPFRLGTELLTEPMIRDEMLVAAAESVAALLLVVVALRYRRLRVFAVLPAALLLGLGLSSGRVLLVEAFPTTFAPSPTGFAAASVARGAVLFQEHCTGCHGADGTGGGPDAPPGSGAATDITAAHVFDHSEGDLFWWISHGIPQAGMPGFADAVDERGRWALVDFVRANAYGHRPADEAGPALRAPDFAFECRDGAADTLGGTADRLVHLAFAPGRDVAERVARAGAEAVEIAWTPDDGTAPAPFCEARGPEIAVAYAVVAGTTPDRLAGAEFLVAGGWLRARGDAAAWRDPTAFAAAIREVAATPLAAAAPAAHVH